MNLSSNICFWSADHFTLVSEGNIKLQSTTYIMHLPSDYIMFNLLK